MATFQSGATRRTIYSLVAVVVVGAAASPSTAWAASSVGASSAGQIAGVIAGAALAGFVICALLAFCAPLLRARDRALGWALLCLIALGLLKFALLPLFPGLGIDVGSYEAWALRIAKVGPAHMYEPGYFLDYPPGYLYGLWAAGAVVSGWHLTGVLMRMVIESPALLADLATGLLLFALVRRRAPAMAWLGMALFALNPAALFDTMVWGQSDSVFTFLMLLATALALAEEFELGWGVAALAVLTKPQALALLPVLALWTLLRAPRRRWIVCIAAFVAAAMVGMAPFQIGHPWNWLFDLYSSTAAYYHETSVNAFNLMALIGGVRRSDALGLFGVSYFVIGMGMVAIFYLGLGYLLLRRPDADGLLCIAFLATLGFFVLAPRMHERYLYPALAFAVPLAVESLPMLAVLAGLSVTFFVNLAYVMHALDNHIFLAPRDTLAMAGAVANTCLLGAGVYLAYVVGPAQGRKSVATVLSEIGAGLFSLPSADPTAGVSPARARPGGKAAAPAEADLSSQEGRQCPLWSRLDTAILSLLVAAGTALHFWRIGLPNEIVFDEVHFVGQARHYLHGERFLDPHPPLAKLLIAASILLFGDHAWSWRLANATLGTILVGITYLLGRRMFNSRLAGALSATFVLCDGMFIVDSRIAVLDIVYVTFAAWSYLLFFRFVQAPTVRSRRNALFWMAITLGLCLGSKLYVPGMIYLLVMGFTIWVLLSEGRAARLKSPMAAHKREVVAAGSMAGRRATGAFAMVTAVAAIIYLATFIPHYVLGWWGGIFDLFRYYGKVIWYEKAVASATHPYASPWWSWPLMLRPIAYWQNFPPKGDVATIWGAGNPASWWGALTAIMIVGLQAIERKSLPRAFLIIGYIALMAIWVPIDRTLFLYHYMPAVYMGYLALGAILAECWAGRLLLVEKIALLLTLVPLMLLGLGAGPGTITVLIVFASFAALLGRGLWDSRFVCAAFVCAVLVCFVYFLPLWIGLPISRAGYYARMWLQGPGLRNWI